MDDVTVSTDPRNLTASFSDTAGFTSSYLYCVAVATQGQCVYPAVALATDALRGPPYAGRGFFAVEVWLAGGDDRYRADIDFFIPFVIARGGDGNDELIGSNVHDSQDGGPGDDRLDGRDGSDSLDAGEGDDVVIGGPGDDGLYGSFGSDVLEGGPGRDFLRGDLIGPEDGDDRLLARDGEEDRLICGAGFDVAIVDALDVLPDGDCEQVEVG